MNITSDYIKEIVKALEKSKNETPLTQWYDEKFGQKGNRYWGERGADIAGAKGVSVQKEHAICHLMCWAENQAAPSNCEGNCEKCCEEKNYNYVPKNNKKDKEPSENITKISVSITRINRIELKLCMIELLYPEYFKEKLNELINNSKNNKKDKELSESITKIKSIVERWKKDEPLDPEYSKKELDELINNVFKEMFSEFYD